MALKMMGHALKYAARGWAVFPCHWTDDGVCSCGKDDCVYPKNQNAGKHPRTQNGYKDATTEEAQIRLWWGKWPRANIGVACAPSNLLCLDIDPRHGGDHSYNDLARDIGRIEAPRVQTGSGGWHFYVTAPIGTPGGVLRGCKGIDVKYIGYVLAPPSVHPCGEPYKWEIEGEPTDLPKQWLDLVLLPPNRMISKPTGVVCEDELIDALRCIPAEDHETWIHVGMSIQAAVGDGGVSIWDEWSSTASNYNPDEIPKRWHSFSQGGGITSNTVFGLARQHGWDPPLRIAADPPDYGDEPPRTDDEMPPEFNADANIIDIGPAPRTPSTDRQAINLSSDIPRIIDEAEEAILNMPRRNLYQRSGALVRITRDAGPAAKGQERPPGAVAIKRATPGYVREICSRAAAWFKFDARSKKWVSTMPPTWVPEIFSDRGQWRIPPIVGIIAAPTLRPDGTLLDSPGYDYPTGLLYLPGGTKFPDIPHNPTHEDAIEAMAELEEPFVDFPFSTKSDKAAILSSILALVCRAAIAGPVPLFAVRATTAGSGKTLLADLCSIIGTGRAAPKFAQAEKPEEERKRLLAVAMEGDQVLCIDNVVHPLGTGPLDMALTGGTVKDRVLGITGNAEAPFRPVCYATGNNLQVRGDTGRRIIPVDIDPRCERPELRSGWKHANIQKWVTDNRPRLVAAALTVCRAHALAGYPEDGLTPLGSFEDYSRVARAAVVWAGYPDPCANSERVRSESDPELDTLRNLLHAWQNHCADRVVTLRDICEEVDDPIGEQSRALNNSITEATAGRSRGSTATQLGYVLRKYRGRMVDGLRFENGERSHAGATWTVVEIGEDT